MASIIGVETLQHTNGTTAATIDSGGSVAMDNTYSMLRLSMLSDKTSDGVITSWGNPTQTKQLTTFGNNPVTHSSGVFSFAKTGVYRIMFSCRMLHSGGDSTVSVAGQASYDGGSTYLQHIISSEGNSSGGTSTGGITLLDFFNVDNISNCKYRFYAESLAGISQIYGESNVDGIHTTCVFERIADVQ